MMKLIREQSQKIDAMQARIDLLTIDQGELRLALSDGSAGAPAGSSAGGDGGDGGGGDGDSSGCDDAVRSMEPAQRTEDVEDDTNDV